MTATATSSGRSKDRTAASRLAPGGLFGEIPCRTSQHRPGTDYAVYAAVLARQYGGVDGRRESGAAENPPVATETQLSVGSLEDDREEPSGLSLRALRPYLSLLQGQYRDLTIALLLMAVSTAVSLAIPLFAGRLVDRLKATGGQIPEHLLLGLGALLVLQLGGSFFYSLVSRRLGLRTVTRLRRRVFGHLVELPSLFFTHHKPGDLSSRINSDVGSIQRLLTGGAVSLFRAIATLVGAVILMFGLNARLTLVVLLLVPSTIFLVQLFGRRLQKLSRRMYQQLGQISNHVQQVFGAIRLVKVYNNQADERSRFDTMLGHYFDAGMRQAWLTAALESSTQILLWICLIAVVIYGFYLSGQGQTTYGQLVAFMLLAFRVTMPLGALTNLYASAQGAVAAAGRLDEIFSVAREGADDPPRPATVRPAVAAPPDVPGDVTGTRISLDRVSFAYETEGVHVLRDVSLEIAPGAKIGVVGPSGAGKTTLTGLVLRLFDPSAGRLTMDGVPYRDIDLHDLRTHMAYVSQEPILYDDTIEANIRFGRQDATLDQVREAAARAHALEFIERLPAGFATEVGDRGVRLSGGQRQRLSLARAFLRNPRLLVLDEPTSALDAAGEDAVLQALRDLMQGRTAIVVAHRLSLVRDLDRIIVLDDGRIREQGSHDELVAANGLYSLLYELQMGRPDGDRTR